MPRTVEQRIADVRALLAAAGEVVRARSEIEEAIALSTGLTREGVELALTRHLELDATDAELRTLVVQAGDAPSVAVILSANVFVGALRAIAIARAASTDVVVRPSRRDPVFARALIEAAADASLRLDESLDVGSLTRGELHVYGHDRTIAELRARAPSGVRLLGHGAGLGVSWISGSASIHDAGRALAADVVAFDQRGCLSPRIVLVEGDAARADAFADTLHRALSASAVRRGKLPPEERAASERYLTTMAYAGRVLTGAEHAIGIAPADAALVAAPSYRHVHVVPCANAEVARQLLAPLVRGVVAVGSDDVEGARRIAPPWARLSPLGEMQRPRLDGPVDRRVP